MKTPLKTTLLLLLLAVTCRQAQSQPNEIAFAKISVTNLPHSVDTPADQRLVHLLFNGGALAVPEYLNDFENLYTPQERTYITFYLQEFEKETQIPVYIMTIDTMSIRKTEFTHETFDSLCMQCVLRSGKEMAIFIGISAGHGMMMIRNMNMGRLLNDAEAKKVINNGFVPAFKKGNFFEGTFNGLNLLKKKIDQGRK